jgi:glutaredoxin
MKFRIDIIMRAAFITCFLLLFADSGSITQVLHAEEIHADIILYGNEKCGYCRETRRWLDSNNIPYIYRDVELYGTFQEEMYRKLSGAGTARFPVLDIKGQMLVRPSVEDIQKAMRGEKVTKKEERKMRSPLWRPEKKRSLTVKFDSVKPSLREQDVILYTDGAAGSRKLITELKSEKIPFVLKELNLMGNAAFFDLNSRLADSGYGNTIYFPVAEVRGDFLMKASAVDIKTLIIETTPE